LDLNPPNPSGGNALGPETPYDIGFAFAVDMFPGTVEGPTDVVEQIIADNFAGSPQAKLAWPTSSAYEDISARVKDIAVPTLVVAGDQDRQDPVEQHRREVLPRIPGAKLHVIPECGHLVPIDQPDQLASTTSFRHQHQLTFQTRGPHRR
jgi:pimeloyl-ACP methyl ester carboxylesterase